jgi:hypothetical protein
MQQIEIKVHVRIVLVLGTVEVVDAVVVEEVVVVVPLVKAVKER